MSLPVWDRTELIGLNLENLTVYQEGGPIDEGELPAPLKEIAQRRGGQASLFFQIDGSKTWSRPLDELAAKGVIVCDFQTALRDHGEIVREHLGTVVGFDEDKLTALHYAAASSGWLVYVPKIQSSRLPSSCAPMPACPDSGCSPISSSSRNEGPK